MSKRLFDTSPSELQGETLELERREAQRESLQSPNDTAILRDPVNKTEVTVHVADYSTGGIRVLLESEDHPSIGSTVAVDFEGIARPAAVRWVLAKRERGWRIGLQWLD